MQNRDVSAQQLLAIQSYQRSNPKMPRHRDLYLRVLSSRLSFSQVSRSHIYITSNRNSVRKDAIHFHICDSIWRIIIQRNKFAFWRAK